MPKKLFTSTAKYYALYRPGYPTKFFKHIAKTFSLNGEGRCLDLGAGTGQLAIPLARYFDEVVAVDPEQEMLTEGKKAAQNAHVKNIQWIKGSSENLRELGKFRLVVMGRSFHWMNQKKTLAMLYKMIEPGGGIVIVSERRKDTLWTPSSKWRLAASEVIKKHLGEQRRAGSGYFKVSEKRFEDFIRESPFKKFEIYRQNVRNQWDMKGALGFFYSMSFSSKAVLGKSVRAFERDMKRELLKANPSGRFTENTVLEALIVKRK